MPVVVDQTKACRRCGGSGYLPQFAHVEGGVCFRCGGSGIDPGSSDSPRRLSPNVEVGREDAPFEDPGVGVSEPPPGWSPGRESIKQQRARQAGDAQKEMPQKQLEDFSEGIFAYATQFGMSKAKAERVLGPVKGRTGTEQREYISNWAERQYGKIPLGTLPSGKPGHPVMSKTAWSQMSESGRRSYEFSVPLRPGGKPFNPFQEATEQWVPGFVSLPGSEKHQFPLEKTLKTTPWAVEEGVIYTGLEKAEQLPKRMKQMTSRYEQVFISGVPVRRAPWKTGEESRAPERGQVFRTAIMFGPVLPEGQSFISKKYETAANYRSIVEEIPRGFKPELEEVGKEWGYREKIKLFKGHAGVSPGDWSSHRLESISVVDPLEQMSPERRAAVEESGELPNLQVVAQMRRDIDVGRGVGLSTHWGKDLLIRANIEKMLGEKGIDILKSGGVRDVYGMAFSALSAMSKKQYESLMGEERPEVWGTAARRLAEKFTGKDVMERLGGGYGSGVAEYLMSGQVGTEGDIIERLGLMGAEALGGLAPKISQSLIKGLMSRESIGGQRRGQRVDLPSGYRYFEMPGRILSAGQVQAFREAGWLSGEPEDIGGGRYRATVMRPGLELDMFTMLTRAGAFEHGSPMVSRGTMEHFKRYRAESKVAAAMYKQFRDEGAARRRSLEVMQETHLATYGHGPEPEKFTRMTSGALAEVMAAAEQSVREEYPDQDLSDLPIGVKQRALLDAVPKEWGALAFDSAKGTHFFPNPRHISRTSDVIEGEEHAFSLGSSLAALMQAKGVDEDAYLEQLDITRERFDQAVSSENFKKRLSGETPDSLWAGPVAGSYANMPEEVYLPTRIAARAAGISTKDKEAYDRFTKWFEGDENIPSPRMPVMLWREPTTMGQMTANQLYQARWIGAHPEEAYKESETPIFSVEASWEMGGDFDKDDYYIAAVQGVDLPTARQMRKRIIAGGLRHPAGEAARQEEKMKGGSGAISSVERLQEYLQARGRGVAVPVKKAIGMLSERAGLQMQMGVGYNLLQEMKLGAQTPEAVAAAEKLGGAMYQYGQDYKPWEKAMKSLAELRNFGSAFTGKSPEAMLSGAVNIALGLSQEETKTGEPVLGPGGVAALLAAPGTEGEVRDLIEAGDARALSRFISGGKGAEDSRRRILAWAEQSTIGRVAFGRLSAKMMTEKGVELTPELTKIGHAMLSVSKQGARARDKETGKPVGLVDYLQAVEDWSYLGGQHASISLGGFFSPRSRREWQKRIAGEFSFQQPGSAHQPSIIAELEEPEGELLRAIEAGWGSVEEFKRELASVRSPAEMQAIQQKIRSFSSGAGTQPSSPENIAEQATTTAQAWEPSPLVEQAWSMFESGFGSPITRSPRMAEALHKIHQAGEQTPARKALNWLMQQEGVSEEQEIEWARLMQERAGIRVLRGSEGVIFHEYSPASGQWGEPIWEPPERNIEGGASQEQNLISGPYGVAKVLPGTSIGKATMARYIWEEFYPEFQKTGVYEKLKSGEDLTKEERMLTQEFYSARGTMMSFVQEQRERQATGLPVYPRQTELRAELEGFLTYGPQAEEVEMFGELAERPMARQQVIEQFKKAGIFVEQEEPGLAETWRSRPRVGRQEILEAYAREQLTRQEAEGYWLKGTGRIGLETPEREAFSYLSRARKSYADLSRPVERALSHISSSMGAVEESPDQIQRRLKSYSYIEEMQRAGRDPTRVLQAVGAYVRSGALTAAEAGPTARSTGIHGGVSWLESIEQALEQGQPATAARLLRGVPGMGSETTTGTTTVTGPTPEEQQQSRALQYLEQMYQGGEPSEKVLKAAGAFVSTGRLRPSQVQPLVSHLGVGPTWLQRVGEAQKGMPGLARELAREIPELGGAARQEPLKLTPQQRTYYDEFISSVEKLTPEFEKLARTTGQLNQVEQKRIASLATWQEELQTLSEKLPQDDILGQRAGAIAEQLATPEMLDVRARSQAQAQIAGAGFTSPTGRGPLSRFRPSGRGLFSGDLGQLAWGMFNIQRLWRYTGGQVQGLMQNYAGYVGGQQQAMASLGIGEGYTGITSDVLSSRSAMERMMLGLGESAWENYGFIPRMLSGGEGGMPRSTGFGRLLTGAAGYAGVPITASLAANVLNRFALAGGAGAGVLGVASGALGAFGTAAGYAGIGIGALQLGNTMATGIGRLLERRYPERFKRYDETTGILDMLTDVPAGATALGAKAVGGLREPLPRAIDFFAEVARMAGNEPQARARERTARGMRGFLGRAEEKLFDVTDLLRDMGEPPKTTPTAQQEAFERAEEQLLQRYPQISPTDAYGILAGYSEATGRMPDDFTYQDISAAGRMGQLEPGIRQRIQQEGAAVARAGGISLGSEEMAGWSMWYAGLSPAERSERQRVVSAINPLVEQYRARGISMPILGVRTMGYQQATQLGRLAQGDRYMWSRAAAGSITTGRQELPGYLAVPALDQTFQVAPHMQSVEVGQNLQFQTGLRTGTTTLSPYTQMGLSSQTPQMMMPYLQRLQGAPSAYFNQQGGEVPYIDGETIDVTTGGVWGIQEAMGKARFQQQMYGYNMQLGRLSSQMAYQKDMWGIQDQQTALSRGYQQQQFGFQEAQMGITGWYNAASSALQREQILTQDKWWEEGAIRARSQQMERFDWREEDLAFRGAQTSLQFGWQMEDIGEAMRYATGRERRSLMKQRDRATIRYGMEMGQIDTQEDRLEKERQWAEEQFELSKSHHEKQVEWQLKRLELSEQYHAAVQGLQAERLQASREYFQERNRLEDQSKNRQRQYWTEQQQNQIAQVQRAKEHATWMEDQRLKLVAINELQELSNSEMERVFAADGPIAEGMDEIVEAAALLVTYSAQINTNLGTIWR